jgi:hypothetical protein
MDMNLKVNAADAELAFSRQLRRGWRMSRGISRVIYGDQSVLALAELTDIYKPRGENREADRDISVRSVIGSEDRSTDFVEGFLPTHQWMKKRWITVWTLLRSGELSEPILVIEYAGLYFIRDGHHRISAARALGQEFIRARITRLRVPFRLEDNFRRGDLPYFRRLADFQRVTGFFDTVPEARFEIRRDASWAILEKEINCWNPVWYSRHREMDLAVPQEERHARWYDIIYKHILQHVTRESLHYLYPGWGQGDVVLEIIRLWNTFPDPDKYTIEDVYAFFLKRTKAERFLLLPFHLIIDTIRAFRRSSFEERQLFMSMSRIREFRPEFRLPADLGKRYWRRLHRELFITHRLRMKRQLGRSPRLHELVEDWYDRVWLPRTE